ncbi:MAG: host attachment protein [Gammaproteobacteria bacterium]|nr:host attachment protein [Gammaproteobacteria bacterium]
MATARHSSEKTYWVVVADEARAIVYTRNTLHGPLSEYFSLESTAARKKTDELLSDHGGRSFDSVGRGRHTLAREKSSPKQHVAEAFAAQIAERIGKVMHDGSCRGYALIAAPRFLGLLRDALAKTCKVEAFKSVAKEVVGQEPAVLQKLVDGK